MVQLSTKTLEYQATDGVLLEGYVAYLDLPGKVRPGILIAHDWLGVGDFVRKKAEQLAAMGYVALAADVYGKGIRPTSVPEASGLTRQYRTDRASLRGRIRAAYDTLCALDQVDAKHIVVMGYCFGGTTALELARSGAELGQNKGLAYNAEADQASWQAFEAFLAEVAPLPASLG